MALRNQPYIPLYVQDFLTDEKLLECSSSSVGIYIMIMCVMHKSKDYGTILLKQKDKQKDKQSLNFAYKLVKHLPFTLDEISVAIDELVSEDVLQLIGDKLSQKRMISDNELSMKRSEAGKKGGKKTQFDKSNNQANTKANSEDEIEDEIVNKPINQDSMIFEFDNDDYKKAFIEYELFICEKRNLEYGVSVIELNSMQRQLKDWSNGIVKKAIEIIDDNISGGYKKLYQPKDNFDLKDQSKSKIHKDLSYAGNEGKQ